MTSSGSVLRFAVEPEVEYRAGGCDGDGYDLKPVPGWQAG